MKAHCGQGLRIIVAAALLTGVAPGHAQTPAPQEPPSEQLKIAAPRDAESMSAAVMAVRIVTEDGHVLSEAPALLSVAIGKAKDGDQVAESSRAVYNRGNNADVQ